jgi:hypothetical protein
LQIALPYPQPATPALPTPQTSTSSQCPAQITFANLYDVRADFITVGTVDRTITDLCYLNSLTCNSDSDCVLAGGIGGHDGFYHVQPSRHGVGRNRICCNVDRFLLRGGEKRHCNLCVFQNHQVASHDGPSSFRDNMHQFISII